MSPTASIEDAEAAYHQLLRLHHPDLHHAGTAEEVAKAGRQTRKLNHAIDQIRTGRVSSPTEGDHAGSGDSHGTYSAPDRSDGSIRGDAWRPPAYEQSDGSDQQSNESNFGAHPRTPCPFCGVLFERRDELTAHVHQIHDLRLIRDRRPARFRSTFVGAKLAGLRHISLIYLAPLNLLAAGLTAVFTARALNLDMAYWSFALCMSPTVIRLLDFTDRV